MSALLQFHYFCATRVFVTKVMTHIVRYLCDHINLH